MNIFKKFRDVFIDDKRIINLLILTNPISYVLALLYSVVFLIGLLILSIYKHSRLELLYFYHYGIHKKDERWIRDYLVWTKKANTGTMLDKWFQSKIDKKALDLLYKFENKNKDGSNGKRV